MRPHIQKKYSRDMPQSLWNRIDQLLAQDQATLLWNMQTACQLTNGMLTAIR